MKKRVSTQQSSRAAATGSVALLVATRKGAFVLKADSGRRTWKITGPMMLGHTVHHVVLDPRDRRTLILAARTGHLGPTVFRSTDFGKTWKEASRPPAFPKAPEGEKGRVVNHVFWVTPGNHDQRGMWYAGTSPQGLFRSDDSGDTWVPVEGFNENKDHLSWMGSEQDGTPDGPKLHSILVDPRDGAHLYLAMSGGGIHESLDGGAHWKTLIQGMEVVEGFDPSTVTFHDPHCVRLAPSNPDRLYQQNHCGIYRLDRPSEQWIRIGKSMPKKIGDIGFPIEVHPRDADTAWVFPMDGSGVWPRTSPGGRPAAYVTRDGGKSWKRQDSGLPKDQAWFTVKRQAMSLDAHAPVGVYFGTTSGEVWASRNEGERWTCIAAHLPEIYAVEAAELAR